MALGDSNFNIQDGGLTFSENVDGIHYKVGVAETGDVNKLYYITSEGQAKQIFGAGPLLDSILKYFDMFKKKQKGPVPFYAGRPENDISGSIGAITQDGTGAAAVATSGTPTGTRDFVIEIIAGGASQTATYRVSTDGGKTWGSVQTTPASGTPIALSVGVEITFTDDATPENSFVAKDKYSFSSVRPTASVAEILKTILAGRQEYKIRAVHVVGETDLAFWESMKAEHEEWKSIHHPVVFFLETKSRSGSGLTIAEFCQERIDEANLFFYNGGIVISTLRVYSPRLERYINHASYMMASFAFMQVGVSIAYAKKTLYEDATQIEDWDEQDPDAGIQAWLSALDDARLCVPRKFAGKDGIYLNSDNMMADSESSYRYLRILRPGQKIQRLGRAETLDFIQSADDSDSGEGGIDQMNAVLKQKLDETMLVRGRTEVKKITIDIDPTQDVLSTGKVEGRIGYVPHGAMSEIWIDVGAENE